MGGTDFVLNRFFSTTFPLQDTVNRIGYPYMEWGTGQGGVLTLLGSIFVTIESEVRLTYFVLENAA